MYNFKDMSKCCYSYHYQRDIRNVRYPYLCIFQHSPQLLQLAIKYNVNGSRLFHLAIWAIKSIFQVNE